MSQIYSDDITVGLYQIFEELIPIRHNCFQKKKNSFQKIEKEGTFFIHFMRPILARYQNWTKKVQRRKLQINILMNTDVIVFNKYWQIEFSNM